MDLHSIPHSPGVYLMRDQTGRILYVGKALDLAKRVSSYFTRNADHPPKISALVASIHHIDYIPTASEREALVMEQGLIRRLQPHFNTMWRDDKSYPYVKLTSKEDFPRLFLTRQRTRDGSNYFGPYPNTGSIRHLLRYLWTHKFFPLRPCRYDFSEAHPLPIEKARGCLYYHTRECPAPCVGRISKDDYRRIAQEAAFFFQGKYKRLIGTWEEEMREASQTQNYERAAQLRDNLSALRHMDERVTVRQIHLDDVVARVDRSRAVTELQQALQLKRPPLRLECFDISHSQGVETVASLVVFERGVPIKSEYRKFKIKTVRGIDDFAGMGEVVGRRYRRLRAEQRPLPDFILIDGGKGQLSAARNAIRSALRKGPLPAMAALAKREEEVFLPDQDIPVSLPKDSAALLLLQRVRDEAHRFAVTFHRLRRAKRFLP
ncbi:MAG: excinuclease ABC subunit UvrC [Elusimicrobiota bacterium]|jgi:excinuclease ABC subunit C